MPEDDDNLVAFAREYFSNDFPNTARSGCPSRAELEELGASKRLPDAGLRAHLLGCSECFALLSSRLAARPSEVTRPTMWERFLGGVTASRAPLAVGALLVVSCFALWALWPSLVVRSPDGATSSATSSEGLSADAGKTAPTPTAHATPAESPEGRPSPPPTKDEPRRANKRTPALAAHLVNIDLASRLVLRGAGDGNGGGPARVPAARNNLAIRLPVGSRSGEYTVSVVDAFGETLLAGKARSRDGKSVALLLDMRPLPPGSYRLCVTHAEGAPSCLPVSVTASR